MEISTFPNIIKEMTDSKAVPRISLLCYYCNAHTCRKWFDWFNNTTDIPPPIICTFHGCICFVLSHNEKKYQTLYWFKSLDTDLYELMFGKATFTYTMYQVLHNCLWTFFVHRNPGRYVIWYHLAYACTYFCFFICSIRDRQIILSACSTVRYNAIRILRIDFFIHLFSHYRTYLYSLLKPSI